MPDTVSQVLAAIRAEEKAKHLKWGYCSQCQRKFQKFTKNWCEKIGEYFCSQKCVRSALKEEAHFQKVWDEKGLGKHHEEHAKYAQYFSGYELGRSRRILPSSGTDPHTGGVRNSYVIL